MSYVSTRPKIQRCNKNKNRIYYCQSQGPNQMLLIQWKQDQKSIDAISTLSILTDPIHVLMASHIPVLQY